MAHAHGGDVTARSREGGGLEVTVTLPLYREAEAASILQRPHNGHETMNKRELGALTGLWRTSRRHDQSDAPWQQRRADADRCLLPRLLAEHRVGLGGGGEHVERREPEVVYVNLAAGP